MNLGWRQVRIGELVCPVESVSPLVAGKGERGSFVYVDLSAVDNESKKIAGERSIPRGEAPSRARQLIREGDILVSTVRPNLNAVAAVPKGLDNVIASTGFCVLRPEPSRLSGRYLFHWLRTDSFISKMVQLATGQSYPAVSDAIIKNSCLPLPDIEEQRRIAAILDQAEALRTKRRQALAKLNQLLGCVFDSVFGHRQSWPNRWRTITFDECLEVPFRNGFSPSKSGTAPGEVLTLSAVTGSRFESKFAKEALFDHPPASDQMVKDGDFLICRGNGNLGLVGKGFRAGGVNKSLLFPDTIIASKVSPEVFDPYFHEFLWNSPATRVQIEQLARTTNGTYKVNQSILGAIKLICPPIELQRVFGKLHARLDEVSREMNNSLDAYSALFASLQHWAFNGEL